jgi:hypothetical protein
MSILLTFSLLEETVKLTSRNKSNNVNKKQTSPTAKH